MKSDGVLYFEKDGEYKPLGKISEIEVTELAPDTDLEDIIPEEYRLPTVHEFGFSLENAHYELYTNLCKLLLFNNYRRLHGLRPVRNRIYRHKPKEFVNDFKLYRKEHEGKGWK